MFFLQQSKKEKKQFTDFITRQLWRLSYGYELHTFENVGGDLLAIYIKKILIFCSRQHCLFINQGWEVSA